MTIRKLTPEERVEGERLLERFRQQASKEIEEENRKKQKIDQIKTANRVETDVTDAEAHEMHLKQMNYKRKVMLSVAIGIIVVMGFFPPWTYTFKSGSIYSESSAGYGFLFLPPSPRRAAYAHGVRLDSSRLFLQWILVAGACGGFLLWMRVAKKEEEDNPRTSTNQDQKRITEQYLRKLTKQGYQIKITPPKEVRGKNQARKT